MTGQRSLRQKRPVREARRMPLLPSKRSLPSKVKAEAKVRARAPGRAQRREAEVPRTRIVFANMFAKVKIALMGRTALSLTRRVGLTPPLVSSKPTHR